MEENPQTKPSYALPERKPRTTLRFRKLLLIGFVILLIGSAALLATNSSIQGLLPHTEFYTNASEEAKQFIIAGGNPGVPTKFQVFDALGRTEMAIDVEGLVIDYVERGNVRVASVADPETLTSELYLLGDTAAPLTENLHAKTELAISGDASYITYSAPAEKRFVGPYFSPRAEDWTVMVMNLATREITEIGTGHGAQFADPSNPSKILYSSAEGLVLADLATGERVTNGEVPAFSASFPIRVSDDGTKVLIYDPVPGKYQAYAIDLATLALTPITTIPEQFVSAVLTDTHMYWVKKGQQGSSSELWSLELGDDAVAHKIYTFSDGFIVVRVIHRP